jgi:hypothetical protein
MQLIDDIAAIPQDTDDWVQMRAANALATMGPSAARALPALDAAGQRAFKEEYGEAVVFGGTGIHTWDAIGWAVRQIRLVAPR